MSIAPVRLDDLTWSQMMAAIRLRIPAESGGRWTLHAPVDPGITLLELYAALLEERLYWMDRTPEVFTGALLGLLGLEPPAAAVPAGTVLRITKVPAGTEVVAAGTAFLRDPRSPVPFTLTDDTTVLPVTETRIRAGGQDRTADLNSGRVVALLPADGSAATAGIVLAMPAPVLAPPDAWLSLLFDLAVPDPGRVPAGWLPTAVANVPPPAGLTWAYQDLAGSQTAFAAGEVDDGTQGLRRSGVVRLRIPDAWRTVPAAARHEYVVVLRTDQATFSAPPQLRRLAVNVSAAVQRSSVEPADEVRHRLGDAFRAQWLPLPRRRLVLPAETRGSLLSVTLTLRERDDRTYDWVATPDLGTHRPGDRVFRLDRAGGTLTFGDGRCGRIPTLRDADPEPVTAIAWTLGGGTAGNGGLTANWRTEDARFEAENPVAAEGGADPETFAQARIRVAEQLRRPTRAVTRKDHETVARDTPGVDVARPIAVTGDQPGRERLTPGVVSVYIVPGVPRPTADQPWDDFVSAPVPDPGVLCAVRQRLAEARLLGTAVHVREPRYRPTRLLVDLAGGPVDPAAIRVRIDSALRRYLDPLVGGDDGEGRPAGLPLRPSALIRVAQEAAGAPAVDRVAIWVPATETWEDCKDVPIGGSELAVLDTVQVRFGGRR